ncbi:cytoplasmic protein [Gracilibacillus boraciitolerans JCM 21714]|uniref:Cytoplasmic protein n=2 Tax=Gracilibacillus boraciitolerans TaxID=307521 RepID=W4VJB6_9BACI|nr:cytoplasmic protein [Gracilibacillus boraciitolerans JCM 21714]
MINNDILIRLRYALDIKDKYMLKIFELGGINLTIEEVQSILTKPKSISYDDELDETEDDGGEVHINNREIEHFLNGLIIYKRGKQEQKPGQPERPPLTYDPVNNSLLKKIKIALQLTSEDVIDIFENAGITVTKGELSALLRKKDHKNFKECGDKYARNFLKGLTVRYRG